jgi:hypothetical protein
VLLQVRDVQLAELDLPRVIQTTAVGVEGGLEVPDSGDPGFVEERQGAFVQ